VIDPEVRALAEPVQAADPTPSEPLASPPGATIDPPAAAGRASGFRQVGEFLVLLLTGILVARTFAAEAYIVPTGSMAPTLLGMHRAYTCSNCKFRFALGIDEEGRGGRPVCPNCGQFDPQNTTWVEGSGDRLLVHKFLFDLRSPQRWEAAVFQNPADPGQAYVKRIVGLPGESILIRGGDLYIDGRIARKTLEQQRALRILVYDNDYVPADSDRFPRWMFRREATPPWWGGSSGWSTEGRWLVHHAVSDERDGSIDWAHYRHWQADANRYGPLRDFIAYNGLDLPGENRVEDLMVEAEVEPTAGLRVAVRLVTGNDRFVVTIPFDQLDAMEVRRNGRLVEVNQRPTLGRSPVPASRGATPRHHLEASLIDRRLIVALDGHPLFEPYDFESATTGPARSLSPVSLGVNADGEARLSSVRVYRDVYYTDALINALRRPFGVGEPYHLGPDEYFVLGDNSPVSNDSRFWPESPVVRRELFVGKPFLVHLPSQAVPLQVFGREVYWIPDPREIRYIR
jgi:signal peptidase I